MDTPGVNHVALVAPPTPGTDVTKDAEHSWAGTPKKAEPKNETPSDDHKKSGLREDHPDVLE